MYDVAVIGGGLAGLSLALQTAREGFRTILFEKESYPFHKVCGEYISMESWNFLEGLGVSLSSMKLPIIRNLVLSGKKGKLLEHALPLGGFGISRYLLDGKMAELCKTAGVTVAEKTKVNEIAYTGDHFNIETSRENFSAKVACGSFGKRSNLDIKWNRPFISEARTALNNYVGIKYHVYASFPSDTIALHIFQNGYCGIVKIEEDKYNLCYLTTAANLRACDGNIERLENEILSSNIHLKKIFGSVQKINAAPYTISQISFEKKEQVEQHILMIGDAAGMITPLCGNGMSMALHGSKIGAGVIARFLNNETSRQSLEEEYIRKWKNEFASRLRMGRRIQRLFANEWMTGMFIGLGRRVPGIIRGMIRRTHGEPF